MSDDFADNDAGDEDPGTSFASLMSGAARVADPERDEDAPYGYKADGTAKKSNGGRPRRYNHPTPPTLEELRERRREKAAETEADGTRTRADGTPIRPRDRAPSTIKRPSSPSLVSTAAPVHESAPPFRQGQIARGVNKLYRKAGKIVRAMDHDIGTAIIEATRKEDEDDVTVGEAWEELARTNPRIRKVLLKMIAGGAWGQLVMAHAPILMAIMMKDQIKKFIPFMSIIESLAESDEDSAEGEGGLPGGLNNDDVAQASRLAQEQMAKMGFNLPPGMVAMVEEKFRGQVAANGASNGTPPPGTEATVPKRQPRRTSRTQRSTA